ncbi:hypothetical protein ACCQ22_18700 [Xanthomonas axonopodis pv. desmodiirotundifolii]|uniref:hypothetical protein n=1 Tax=Xanthomonas axonopodis TaxID=53413 RepID=UPI003557C1B1
MKQWQRAKVRGINASHERTPQPVLFLVLRFSDAAGGGRIALTLKATSAAFPKAASAHWRLFCCRRAWLPDATPPTETL